MDLREVLKTIIKENIDRNLDHTQKMVDALLIAVRTDDRDTLIATLTQGPITAQKDVLETSFGYAITLYQMAKHAAALEDKIKELENK